MIAIIKRRAKLKYSCVNVIGCGFAGIECALFLAEHGINVHLFDCKANTYHCDCHNCEIYGSNEENELFARNLLRKEIKILGSSLIEKEEELLKKEKFSSCVADKLLTYGVERVKNHPRIEFFNLCVRDINLKEINVIASGPHTESGLFENLKALHGSMRLFDTYNIYPLVENITESEFVKKGDSLFLPMSYKEYITLCNAVLSERNALLSKGRALSKDVSLIEEMVTKDKDALKSNIMRPIFIEHLSEKPYACLKLNLTRRGYEIEGFASALPPECQYRIINSIKGLERAVILRTGKSIANNYINAPFVINNFSQSNKFSNIFYAGNISGVYGHIESMASGLYVGYNVLRFINGLELLPLPKETAIGALIDKVVTAGVMRNQPVIASYDIIKTQKDYKTIAGKSKYLLENCEIVLTKFKEDYLNGKHI